MTHIALLVVGRPVLLVRIEFLKSNGEWRIGRSHVIASNDSISVDWSTTTHAVVGSTSFDAAQWSSLFETGAVAAIGILLPRTAFAQSTRNRAWDKKTCGDFREVKLAGVVGIGATGNACWNYAMNQMIATIGSIAGAVSGGVLNELLAFADRGAVGEIVLGGLAWTGAELMVLGGIVGVPAFVGGMTYHYSNCNRNFKQEALTCLITGGEVKGGGTHINRNSFDSFMLPPACGFMCGGAGIHANFDAF